MFHRFIRPYLVLLATFSSPLALAQSDDTRASSTINVCEFIADTAARLNSNLEFETLSKDKGAPFVREYLIQNVLWKQYTDDAPVRPGGPTFEDDGHTTYHNSDYNRYYEDYIRWSHNIGYLPYRGTWYRLLARTDSGVMRGAKSTGAFLSAAFDDTGLVCAFDTMVTETSVPEFENWHRNAYESGNDADCVDAVNPANIIRADIALPEDAGTSLISAMEKDFRKGMFKRNVYIVAPLADGKHMPRTAGPVLKIDIDNNGIEDTLLRVTYSEASNSTCGTTYYDVISDDMTKLGEPKLREAVFAAQGMTFWDDGQRRLSCGRTHEVISMKGRNYISSRQKLSNQIFAIEDGMAVKLCRSKFTVEPKVVFTTTAEISKRLKLGLNAQP